MGVQDVSILQNSPCKSLNITHLTAITQYKWDHPKSARKTIGNQNVTTSTPVVFRAFFRFIYNSLEINCSEKIPKINPKIAQIIAHF